VRILNAYILTFDGFSDPDSEILKPRWLLTVMAREKHLSARHYVTLAAV